MSENTERPPLDSETLARVKEDLRSIKIAERMKIEGEDLGE